MIGAIIQARKGGSRFPGKVMQDINGKPMLGRIIDRVKMAIGNIIVATPDIEIARYAKVEGVKFYIGVEDDVLHRYYQAASVNGLTDVIRLTADNPLVDPYLITEMIKTYQKSDVDYLSNNLVRTYPLGMDIEIFSFKTLVKAWQEAKEPYEREHVTPYIKKHSEIFRIFNVENDIDLSGLRWTVDYPEDLEFVREIYSNLQEGFTMQDILEYQKEEAKL